MIFVFFQNFGLNFHKTGKTCFATKQRKSNKNDDLTIKQCELYQSFLLDI